LLGRGAGPSGSRHARFSYEHRPRAARSLLDSASRQHETGPWGTQPPHLQTGNADTAPGTPTQQPEPPTPAQADAINHTHLTNTPTYQLVWQHA